MSYVKEKMLLNDVSGMGGFAPLPANTSTPFDDDDWMEETYHEDFTMQNLVKWMDTVILGNTEVKKTIAKALYMGFEYGVSSNTLIIGQSGSGKSLLLNALAKEFPKACGSVIISGATLTSEGYKGDIKISSELKKVIGDPKNHIKPPSHHVFVQIDEFDKILDNVGEHNYALRVQDELLMYMSHMMGAENVSFICYGAFSELFERHRKKPIGFGATDASDEPLIVTRDMLVDLNFRAELIGRFDRIAQTEPFDFRQLANMELEKLARSIDMGINIDRDILYRIADESEGNQFGARLCALKIRELVEEYIYNHPDCRTVEIFEEAEMT